MNTTYTITVNGVAGTREEVVRPVRVAGVKTLVSYLNGSRVSTKWVKSDRIQSRSVGA